MDNSNDRDVLVAEFWRECLIRRTCTLLEKQRQLLREDIYDLVAHIALLVLPMEFPTYKSEQYKEILIEALERLGDDAFAKLVLDVVRKEAWPQLPPL